VAWLILPALGRPKKLARIALFSDTREHPAQGIYIIIVGAENIMK
jgi:hypothetical protein